MSTHPTNAIVNIWFGKLTNTTTLADVGHTSMWIGPNSRPYISWWPDNGSLRKMNTYEQDESEEGGQPHRVYYLRNLNEHNMLKKFNKLNHASQLTTPHYRLMTKNCANVVWRVLEAGGAGHYANAWYTQSLTLWTPNRINHLCKELVKRGHGTEVEHRHRPQAWLPVIG